MDRDLVKLAYRLGFVQGMHKRAQSQSDAQAALNRMRVQETKQKAELARAVPGATTTEQLPDGSTAIRTRAVLRPDGSGYPAGNPSQPAQPSARPVLQRQPVQPQAPARQPTTAQAPRVSSRPRYIQNGNHTGIYVNGVEWKRDQGVGANQPAMQEQQRQMREYRARQALKADPNNQQAQQALQSISNERRALRSKGVYTPEARKQVGMVRAPRWSDNNITNAISAYRTAKRSGNTDEIARIQAQFRNYYNGLDPQQAQAFKAHVQGLAKNLYPKNPVAQTAQPTQP